MNRQRTSTRMMAATLSAFALVAASSGVAIAQSEPSGQSGAGQRAPSFCGTGLIESLAVNNPIRVAPNISSAVHDTFQRGQRTFCVQDTYVLGGRYTACGTTNANGWLQIPLYPSGIGYAYMTCWKDV
ncbi:hypothetical protein [Streptomyces clavuligerus]|nr:hypothetical protein [Streptomyces clavuligerus]WDN53255.1 hypothetical protein LL058_16160 [Streptomyces clavuligerus]